MSQYSVSPVALNAPGLPFSPVVYQDPDFVALLTSFGLAGQAASTLGEQHARDRHFRDQENAKSDEIDRAVWSRAANEDSATIRLGIRNGTVKLPAGAEPGKFADELVSAHLERLGPVSEAGRQAYMRSTGEVAEALATQSAIDTAKDRNNFADALSNQAYLSDDPAAAVKSAMGAGFDETAAYSKVVMPALKTAAQLGDAKKFERLSATLPAGKFDQDVLILQRHLNAVQVDQAAKTQDAIRAGFQALENDNAPTAQMRQELEQIKPRLTPANYDQINRQIESIEKARNLESKTIGLDAAYGAVRRGGSLEDGDKIIQAMGLGEKETAEAQDHLRGAFAERVREERAAAEASGRQAVYQEAFMGAQSGVPLSLAQDRTFAVGDKTVTVTRSEQIEAVTEMAMIRLAQGKQPADAIVAQAHWLSTNGVENPRWKSLVHAAFTSSGNLETAGSAPTSTIEALILYRQVRSTNPGLAQSMFPEAERRYFDTAITWLGDTAIDGKPDYLGALRMAHKAVHAPPGEMARVAAQIDDRSVIETAKSVVGADGYFFGPDYYQDIQNRAELEAAIKTEAIRYAPGMSRSAALSRAADNMRARGTVVNGFWTDAAVSELPQEVRQGLPAIGQLVIENYINDNKSPGIFKSDLGLVYNSATSRWIIQDRLNRQAPGAVNATTFTNQQVIEMYRPARDAAILRQNELNKRIRESLHELPILGPGGG